MISVILEFEVEDFISWKKIFNNNHELRTKNNISITGVYVSMTDADHVIVVADAPSIDIFEYHFFGHDQVSRNLNLKAIINPPKITYHHKMD